MKRTAKLWALLAAALIALFAAGRLTVFRDYTAHITLNRALGAEVVFITEYRVIIIGYTKPFIYLCDDLVKLVYIIDGKTFIRHKKLYKCLKSDYLFCEQ